jgi:hypothetical protein
VKVKASNDFKDYRLNVLNRDDGNLSIEDFRALQQGGTVEVTKEFYHSNKHILEVIEPPKKGVKDGD